LAPWRILAVIRPLLPEILLTRADGGYHARNRHQARITDQDRKILRDRGAPHLIRRAAQQREDLVGVGLAEAPQGRDRGPRSSVPASRATGAIRPLDLIDSGDLLRDHARGPAGKGGVELVELRGFEPLTPRLPALCSPS
jgi:hypothetical protein